MRRSTVLNFHLADFFVIPLAISIHPLLKGIKMRPRLPFKPSKNTPAMWLAAVLMTLLLISPILADEDLLERLVAHNGQVLVDASYFIDNPGHGDDQGGGGDPPPPSGALLEISQPFEVDKKTRHLVLSDNNVVADGLRIRIDIEIPKGTTLDPREGRTVGYVHYDRPPSPQRSPRRVAFDRESWEQVPFYGLFKSDKAGRRWARVVVRDTDVSSGDIAVDQQVAIPASVPLAGRWRWDFTWSETGHISGVVERVDGTFRREIAFRGPSAGRVLGKLYLQLGNPDKGPDNHDQPWAAGVVFHSAAVYEASSAPLDLVIAALNLEWNDGDLFLEVSGGVSPDWFASDRRLLKLYQKLDPCVLAPQVCGRPVAADAEVPHLWARSAGPWKAALEIGKTAPGGVVKGSGENLRHQRGWGFAELALIFGDVDGRGVMPKPGQPYLWPGLECVGSVCDLRRQLKAEVEGVARLTPKGADLERAGIAGLGVWIDAIGNGRARANRRWMVRHALPAVADGGRSASALRGDLVRWRKLRVSLEKR